MPRTGEEDGFASFLISVQYMADCNMGGRLGDILLGRLKGTKTEEVMQGVRQWVVMLCVGMLTCANVVWAENLVIPGSGSPEYVLDQLAKAFNAKQAQHRVVVPPSSGTAGAFRDVGDGLSTLGRVGRPLKDEERAKGFSYIPLGHDPVAVVGGAGVTARSITWQQLVDVFAGNIVNWRELGGSSAPIRAIGREHGDTSRMALMAANKAFREVAYGGRVKMVHLDPQLIELLDRYPTGIGYINRSSLSLCKTAVVPLALEGVDPTPENLEKGKYPIWIEFGLVYKDSQGLSAAAKAFVEFVRSPEGGRLLRAHGILPATSSR